MKCPFCNADLKDENYIGITRCSVCSRPFSIYYALGKEQLEAGLYDEAIKNFHKGLKLFKNTCLLHCDLARAYRHLGQEEPFHYYLNRAMEIDEGVCIGYMKEHNLL